MSATALVVIDILDRDDAQRTMMALGHCCCCCCCCRRSSVVAGRRWLCGRALDDLDRHWFVGSDELVAHVLQLHQRLGRHGLLGSRRMELDVAPFESKLPRGSLPAKVILSDGRDQVLRRVLLHVLPTSVPVEPHSNLLADRNLSFDEMLHKHHHAKVGESTLRVESSQ